MRLFEGDDALEKLTSENDNFEFDNNPYYEELYETYSKSVALKKSKPIWNAQLKKICRRYLHEIFGDDLREALKYYWSKRSEDSGHNFLWNVFTESEISSQLYTPQTSSRSEVQSGLDEKIFC